MIQLILSILMSVSFADLKKPTTIDDLRKVTARISDPTMQSGGSGSVIESGRLGSLILTNNHVCEAMEPNWIVTVNNVSSKITKFKQFDKHDLCIIKVRRDYGVSLKIAGRLPKFGDTSIVSGHPIMFPQIVTKGHFSEELRVQVLVDVRPCTKEEYEQEPMECTFAGKAVVEIYDSQLSSNLIQPGNSGSAVFNEKGEIIGVVFAGAGEIGFSLNVPALHVSHFVSNHEAYSWKEIEKKTDAEKTQEVEEESRKKQFCKNNKTKLCSVRTDLLQR